MPYAATMRKILSCSYTALGVVALEYVRLGFRTGNLFPTYQITSFHDHVTSLVSMPQQALLSILVSFEILVCSTSKAGYVTHLLISHSPEIRTGVIE